MRARNLRGIGAIVLLGVGGVRVISGTLSLGELVAFQLLMASFLQPVRLIHDKMRKGR